MQAGFCEMGRWLGRGSGLGVLVHVLIPIETVCSTEPDGCSRVLY